MKKKVLNELSKPWYALFGVTVLLIAVAGSAYAYYQATASNNTTVTGTAAGPGTLQLTVTNLSTGATGNLIPMDTDLTILNQAALGYGNSSGYNATKQCIDKYGYTVCKVYQISITNTGTTSTIITGGVTSLSGANTPNLTCTVMSDNHTVTTIKNCVGSNTLANKVTLAANATNTYYVMVYINNINGSQSDNGTFNGTVEFNTGEGGIKARFHPSADEVITNLFSKTGTVTNNSIAYDIDGTHKLLKDQNGNIRYYGSNPDNYVYFNCDEYPETNCETWRIIGVVDDRVKLIRGSSIGQYSWDTAANNTAGNNGEGINEWSQADIMKLLNPGYNAQSVNNSLYYTSGSGTCYNGKSNATTSCDFTSTGLKNDVTRSKIADATYYTGGWNANTVYPNVMMEKERGTDVGLNTNDGITRTTSWVGKLALAYPSDYGYAADLSLCSGKNLSQYSDSTCTSNNWMRNIITNSGAITGRIFSPRSGYAAYIWHVAKEGDVKQSGNCYYPGAITPVLYLSKGETIESGDGTSANPYRLS